MASHSSRGGQQNQNQAVPEFLFDLKLNESKQATDAVAEVIDQLIQDGAKILYMKYIQSQIVPYASRTLARELIMNATWASIPLDCKEPVAEPDDDLGLPPIDEWAGGVLPVRGTESAALRCSQTPQREFRKPPVHKPKFTEEEKVVEAKNLTARSRSGNVPFAERSSRKNQEKKPKKTEPQLTEAQIITKTFDEARKKTNVIMKAVTVDSDFTVIQINEPKGLPPALIIPKVSTKGKQGQPKERNVVQTMPRIKKPVLTRNDQRQKRRRPQTRLVEPDVPVFDEEVADISYSDRFVCAPGVTFKDGSMIKSRPQVVNSAQLTRAQYEAYLEEMKRNNSE